MSITSIGLSDDERKGASVSEPPAQRRGTLAAQWDNRDAFTVEETGEILGLSRPSAYVAAKRGDLGAIRIGKRWIVPRRALEKLLGATEADVTVFEPTMPVPVPVEPPVRPQRVELAIEVSAAAPRGRGHSRKQTVVISQPTSPSAGER
jgi:excisionase family DNA binding protein